MEYDHHRHQTYRQRIARDSKRFEAADKNSDGKLDRDDFADFLHPGELIIDFTSPIKVMNGY